MKKYRVYENKGKYEIYGVYGNFIVACTNENTANEVAKLLDNDIPITQDDIEIINRASELNAIKEPVRERYRLPVNDNYILDSQLAKTTRNLLKSIDKQK